MRMDEGLAGIGRRRFLTMAGATGAVGLAGCLGGDDSGENGGSENGSGENGDDGDDGPAGDSRGPEDEYTPSDFDFVPTDGFNDTHPDIEIPDEPGTAVVVLDGDRTKLEELDQVSGGPISESTYEMALEDDDFVPGRLFGFNVIFSSEAHPITVNMGQQFVGGFDVRPGFFQSDQFNIITPEGEDEIRYWEYPDGTVRAEETDFASYLEEPFITVDRDGILTAVAGPADIKSGAGFEYELAFGANIGAGWYE